MPDLSLTELFTTLFWPMVERDLELHLSSPHVSLALLVGYMVEADMNPEQMLIDGRSAHPNIDQHLTDLNYNENWVMGVPQRPAPPADRGGKG